MKPLNIITTVCLIIMVGLLGFLCVKSDGDVQDQPIPTQDQPMPPSEITGKGYQTPIELAGTATTSPVYLATSTEPTTYSFAIGAAVDQVDVYVWVSPSSTTARLNMETYYSLDNIDWHGVGHATTTAQTVEHATASTTDYWMPVVEGWRKFPPITDINAKYIKFKFDRGTAIDGNLAFYAVALIKSTY